MAVLHVVLATGCSRPAFHCTGDEQCSSGVCQQGVCAGAGVDVDGGSGIDGGSGVDAPTSSAADAALDDASGPTDAAPDGATPGTRNACVEGLAIEDEGNDCVDAVCAVLPACCTTFWDELCVQKVETTPVCARSCSQVAVTGDNERFGGRRIALGMDSADFTAFEDNFADEPGSGPRINKVAIADYDSDGRPDFAASSPHGWYVLHNESDASTVRFRVVASHIVTDDIGGHHIAWADWDGDGDLDFAVTNVRAGLYLVRHVPGAVVPFVQEAEPLLPMDDDQPALAFDWGDLDGDKDMDMVAAQNRHGIVLRNQGSGQFQRVAWDGQAQFGIRLCDVVGSPLPEVITATYDGPLHVYATTGVPGAQPMRTIPAPRTQNYRDIRCADLDGDDDLDVIAGAETDAMGVVRIFRNEGDPGGLATTPAWTLEHTTDLDAFDVGDLDGDRRLDLVISYDNELRWLVNTTPAGADIVFSSDRPTISSIGEYALDLGPEPVR
jgi:hypothetical protein